MDFKDITIKNIVQHLQNKFGVNNIIVKDYWEADNCAIGLTDKTGELIVYISTWQKGENEYFVSIENSVVNKREQTDTVEFDNINIDKVEEIIKLQFCL